MPGLNPGFVEPGGKMPAPIEPTQSVGRDRMEPGVVLPLRRRACRSDRHKSPATPIMHAEREPDGRNILPVQPGMLLIDPV